jgi:hypothetical protein
MVELAMKTVIKVALIALLWITLINPGNLPPDTDVRLQMSHALWTKTEEIPSSSSQGTLGVQGKRYYFYDLGQSILMLPADWVGTKLHSFFPQIKPYLLRELAVSLLVVIPLNVLVVLSCYWLLRLFDFHENIAASASLVFLLGTTALHYSQVFQQNNPVLLCVVLAYACVLAYLKYDKIYYILGSGLAIGFAIFIRSTAIIHALTVFGFLIGAIIYKNYKFKRIYKTVLFWMSGVIPFVILSRLFNYFRFGSFSKSGAEITFEQARESSYAQGIDISPNYPFIHPPYIGIFGVLFSPSKSIFIYDPLLLPCLILGLSLRKKLSPYLTIYLISAIFGLIFHIILTSKLDFWHGDGAWAARYHVTSVHLILIPLIALLIAEFSLVNRLKKWLIVSLIILSILVQIPSLVFDPSVNSGWVNFAKPESFLRFRLAERVASIGCLVSSSPSPNCLKNELSGRVNSWTRKFNRIQGFLQIIWILLFIVALISTFVFLWFSMGLNSLL